MYDTRRVNGCATREPMPVSDAVACRTDAQRSCPKEARWRPAAPATGPRRRVGAPRHGLIRPAAASSNMRGLPWSWSWPAFAGLDRRRQSMEVLISSLRGSVTHQLAVEVYLRHCDAGAGACAGCGGRVPCPARRHAAPVIEAAGEDPRWYDAQAMADRPGAATAPQVAEGHRPDQPAKDGRMPAVARGVEGYAVGGRGRRADAPYTEYER